MTQEAYIYDFLRTPFGRQAGALSSVRPDDMAAVVLRALVQRNPFPHELYEDVVLGCANQAGEDSRNIARHAGLLAGLPVEVPGQTVNRLCASGMASVLIAANAVRCGEGELFLAGGVESMTRGPFAVAKSERPFSRDFTVFDTSLGSRFPNPKFVSAFGNDALAETSDNIARDVGITRSEADEFALASQRKYARAKQAGYFKDEILPVPIPTRNGPPVVVDEDEHPRPDTTLEALAKLRPLQDGVTTAGNSSGINDGAGALIVGSRKVGEDYGVKPLARVVSSAAAGVPPRVMGFGPVSASLKCLKRAGLSLAELDVIEINEAFAAQVLGCLNRWGIAYDDARVNPNGGAIAVGHPLGASGARLTMTAIRQLKTQNGRYALVTLCIGVGQGLAAVLERV